MLVQNFLERSADWHGAKTALICDGQRLSYGEVELFANRLANAMKYNGLSRGDRVVLWLPNSVELVVSIFATLKAGGVFVPVTYSTKPAKLTYILNNCQASMLVTSGRKLDITRRLIADVPSLLCAILAPPPSDVRPEDRILCFQHLQHQFPGSRPPIVNIDLDLACLIYTSGTTGDPKGVMSDHSNVSFAASSIIQYLHNTPDDIVIDALPLSFDYGLYQLLMVFKFGGTLVLEKGFSYPAMVLQRMQDERVTGFPGVPTIFSILLQMDLGQYDLRLRYLTNTAATLPPSHIAKIRAALPDAQIYSMYGLTESKRTLYMPPEELDRRPGSVGIAIPGTEVWIEDAAGNRLGPGQVGELVVRGRHVMRGYWNDPLASAQRFRPGSLPGERLCYTGDLFSMDEEGYMYFIGRSDDIIKSRGEKVSPKEIENVLYALPGVREAAVVGTPDEILGQAIKAFIVRQNPALSEADVLAHCRANLEDLMVPRYIVFCKALPKTSSGKITKTDLE
ncbi:MAG: AMP-binding protein [Anaerolineae bacterium]|nr:AMP-binding protein [Anaerolineae bacterium]